MVVRIPILSHVVAGVWISRTKPEDLAFLRQTPIQSSRRNVLLTRGAALTQDSKFIEIRPSECYLACSCPSEEVVIVDIGDWKADSETPAGVSGDTCVKTQGDELNETSPSCASSGPKNVLDAVSVVRSQFQRRGSGGNGDQQFVNDVGSRMPPSLSRIGLRILEGIREHYPIGSLERTDRGVYVERPDNFRTIKPQPKDGSFAITLRGKRDRFHSTILQVKKDRSSYSRFKVSAESEVDEAIRLVLSARRKSY